MKPTRLFVCFSILFFICFCAKAQSFVYKPMNPFFGGDTFNYQIMMSSASAQNQFEKSKGSSFDGRNDLNNFSKNLNRQLLNKISNQLFKEQFGDGDLQPGTYKFGSMVLDITEVTNGLLINILDTQTGDQTQILIPNN